MNRDIDIDKELADFEKAESKKLGLDRDQWTEKVNTHFTGAQRPHTTLLVPDRGIQIEENDGAAIEPHLLASTHPSPGTQRTGVPDFMSTRSAASSSGRPLAHSPNPASASCSLSG